MKLPTRTNIKEHAVQALAILCGLLVLSTAFLGYRLYVVTKHPELAAKNEVGKLVKEVGTLVQLPPDEIPTLATVSDPDKLKDQPFFKDAQVGDKVLIYTSAGRAILYRPATHKIIEIAPLGNAPVPAP